MHAIYRGLLFEFDKCIDFDVVNKADRYSIFQGSLSVRAVICPYLWRAHVSTRNTSLEEVGVIGKQLVADTHTGLRYGHRANENTLLMCVPLWRSGWPRDPGLYPYWSGLMRGLCGTSTGYRRHIPRASLAGNPVDQCGQFSRISTDFILLVVRSIAGTDGHLVANHPRRLAPC